MMKQLNPVRIPLYLDHDNAIMADKFDQLVILASEGDAAAQCDLADIYYDIFDEHFDPEVAAKWYL